MNTSGKPKGDEYASTHEIVREMLDHAVATGATRVDIEVDDDQTVCTHDNGRGIDNPASILTPDGETGKSPGRATARAGAKGFRAVAERNRAGVIESWASFGWRLEPETSRGLAGPESIDMHGELTVYEEGPRGHGTRVTFAHREEDVEKLRLELGEIGRKHSLPVTMNGAPCV